MKQKLFTILISLTLFLFAFAPVWAQVGSIDPAFNPNSLIPDAVFSDTQTFGGSQGIQQFLESKGSVLANTDPAFLVQLKEPQINFLKQGLEDPEPSLPNLRTAAELIWDASVQSGLNPQVILVTLNKEQGLITSSQSLTGDVLQTALDHAMGFACPDSTGCGNLFPGFYYQLFGNYDSSNNRYLGAAKSLMKSFTTAGGRGPQVNGQVSHVGDTITLENTLGGFDGVQPEQSITIANLATAALYRFTPHVFNGNYNFWRFFQSWFKYPSGTLFGLAGDSTTYVVENGQKLLVPAFVAQARSLNLSSRVTISPTEFSEYPSGPVYGPADNSIVTDTAGNYYVFINNIKHPASAFVIGQRGLSTGTAVAISDADSALFTNGPVLTPSKGTILKGQSTAAIYQVQNGQLALFTPYTFSQRKISGKQVQVIPDTEISTYPKSGFVPPLDGSLVKGASNPLVYLIDQGLRKPVTADIARNRGFSLSRAVVISDNEVSALTLGPFAALKDKTFFAVGSKTGPLYEFNAGVKDPVSSFVAKQRFITPDYVFSTQITDTWYDGISVPPKDGTLVKGQTDGTIFLVKTGQLDAITAAAFKAHRYSFKNVKTLPQAEVDAYAKGDDVTK